MNYSTNRELFLPRWSDRVCLGLELPFLLPLPPAVELLDGTKDGRAQAGVGLLDRLHLLLAQAARRPNAVGPRSALHRQVQGGIFVCKLPNQGRRKHT